MTCHKSLATLATLTALALPAVLSAQASQPLSDAEIAQVVVTANTGEVEAGKAAQSKATNDDVKKFAAMMVKDHSDANTKIAEVTGKAGITPKDNATSQSLQADGAKMQQDLASASGADFDRAYMQGMVAGHQKVLDTFDQVLIPGAQNPDLKKTLTDMRKAVASHLDKAKSLSASIVASK